MRATHTIKLPKDAYEELQRLSETLGFPPELAATYAVRLVNACIREGLLTDVPNRAWPPEADPGRARGGDGRIIAFPGTAQRRARRLGSSDGT